MQGQGFLRYVNPRSLLFLPVTVLLLTIAAEYVGASTIQTYSDRLSDSAPGESSNHTIQFTTTVPIPPGGFIRFTPEPGEFDIPAADFDADNVALYVNEGSGYTLRAATSTTPTLSEDGVVITAGTSGNIEVILNATDGIAQNATVRLLVGNHTPNATSTDVGIMNPATPGTYEYYIAAGNGITDAEVNGKYAIIENVSVGPIDTRETDPPIRFNGSPSGNISGTVTSLEVSLETNEFAKCRYDVASGTPYFSMPYEFGTSFTVMHVKEFAVATDTTYVLYVRCIDDESNVNIDDYVISFTVLPPPEGTPGPGDEPTGDGSGSGTGTGSSGSGGGSSSGGSSGGGSGGGGSGGSDGGGFESTARPYQSGDGRVIITGYAFPRSTIVALVDGQIAEQTTSGGDGTFSITIDAIARGAYTFGVYGVDRSGTRSSTFSTTFTVTGSRGSTLSNVNVMPSIRVSPNPVDPDSTLTVSGYAIPNATVTLENQNDKTSASLKTFTTTSDANGAWTVTIPTTGFTKGTYKVRAKAKQDEGASTNFSNYTYYGVGEAAQGPRSPDLNRDGKVNLIDFSILLFWWNSDGGNSNPPADINGDGRVSLTDFSIMIFNWTG